MTVAFQCMFRTLEQWNNNQVTSPLSKPHELSYRSNICSLHFVGESGPTDEFLDPIKFSAKFSKPMVRKLFTQQILFIVYYIIKLQSFNFFDFLKLLFTRRNSSLQNLVLLHLFLLKVNGKRRI